MNQNRACVEDTLRDNSIVELKKHIGTKDNNMVKKALINAFIKTQEELQVGSFDFGVSYEKGILDVTIESCGCITDGVSKYIINGEIT